MRSWPTLNRRQPGDPPARTRRWLVAAGVSGVLAAAMAGGTAAAVVPASRVAAAATGAGQSGSSALISREPALFPPVDLSPRVALSPHAPAGRGAPGGGRMPAGGQRRPAPLASAAAASAPAARQRVRVAARTLRTSCRSVAHIGDSTSADLISPDYLPDPAQRLAARYADVGVRNLRVDASGGRSIVETLPGQVNGYNVARAWRRQGYQGCWVFALGTNDTANVAVGSAVGLTARIDRMMSVARGEPVLWVNTRTLLSSGDWSEPNQELWNTALARALARYPNMRIFNWAAVARPGWFLSDGIHYTPAGCAARAKAIADALARAFPRAGASAASVVR
jgi:hypothetical protein